MSAKLKELQVRQLRSLQCVCLRSSEAKRDAQMMQSICEHAKAVSDACKSRVMSPPCLTSLRCHLVGLSLMRVQSLQLYFEKLCKGM